MFHDKKGKPCKNRQPVKVCVCACVGVSFWVMSTYLCSLHSLNSLFKLAFSVVSRRKPPTYFQVLCSRADTAHSITITMNSSFVNFDLNLEAHLKMIMQLTKHRSAMSHRQVISENCSMVQKNGYHATCVDYAKVQLQESNRWIHYFV